MVAALGYLLLRYGALGDRLTGDAPINNAVNGLVDASAWQRVLGVVQLWGMYWSKMIWPEVLTVAYSINTVRPAASLLHPHVFFGVAVFGVLATASAAAWRRGERIPALLLVALVLSYAPTANGAPLLHVFFAERIWFWPSAWAALWIGWCTARAWPHRTVQAAAVVLVAAMMVRCWVRNAEWRDEGRLLAAAVRDQPEGAAALQLYGQYLVNSNRAAEAVGVLERAVRTAPGLTDAQISLGQAYLGAGEPVKAIRVLQIAEQQFPGYRRTRLLMGKAQQQAAGMAESGIQALERAAAAHPDDVEAELAVVRGLRDWGRTEDALRRLEAGVPRFGTSASWRYEWAVTLVVEGKRDEAIAMYEGVCAEGGDRLEPVVELAMLYLERRGPADVARAGPLTEKAEAMDSGSAVALAARAEWLVATGRTAEAVERYKVAIGKLPAGDPRRGMFEERMRSLGE